MIIIVISLKYLYILSNGGDFEPKHIILALLWALQANTVDNKFIAQEALIPLNLLAEIAIPVISTNK